MTADAAQLDVLADDAGAGGMAARIEIDDAHAAVGQARAQADVVALKGEGPASAQRSTARSTAIARRATAIMTPATASALICRRSGGQPP